MSHKDQEDLPPKEVPLAIGYMVDGDFLCTACFEEYLEKICEYPALGLHTIIPETTLPDLPCGKCGKRFGHSQNRGPAKRLTAKLRGE